MGTFEILLTNIINGEQRGIYWGPRKRSWSLQVVAFNSTIAASARAFVWTLALEAAGLWRWRWVKRREAKGANHHPIISHLAILVYSSWFSVDWLDDGDGRVGLGSIATSQVLRTLRTSLAQPTVVTLNSGIGVFEKGKKWSEAVNFLAAWLSRFVRSERRWKEDSWTVSNRVGYKYQIWCNHVRS